MEGHFLRVETIFSEREQFSGRAGNTVQGDTVQLEIGEHPVADELRNMGLGRLVGYTYAPSHQAVLTSVLESWQA